MDAEHGAIRVLLAEDVATDAELVQRALAKAGADFIWCVVKTRDTFIRALETFEPDIVLSDFLLVDFDGQDAVGIVRQGNPDLPIIIVTGALGDEAAVQLIQAGASDYVLKDRLARLPIAVTRAMAAVEERRSRRQAEADLRASRQQVIESEKLSALGKMAAGIAHELNNPLMGVMNYVEYVLNRVTDESLKAPLSRADRQLRRMAVILHDMLTFARPIDEPLGAVDVAAVIDQTLHLMAPEFTAKGIDVATSVETGLPAVSAKEGALEQVLVNLLLNARDAVEFSEEKRISVAAHRAGDTIVIEVTDSGAGIQADIAPHIFEPFFSTKPPGAGTGLGLSVSLGIMNSLGGSLALDSHPGQGATLVATLPLKHED